MTHPAPWTRVPAARRALAHAEARKRHQAAARHLHRLMRQKRFKRSPRQQKPVPNRSRARIERDAELQKVIKTLMLDSRNHRCSIRKEGVCTGATETWHHVVPRSVAPQLVTEPSNLRPACFPCHHYLGDHPKEAYQRGWLKRSTDT